MKIYFKMNTEDILSVKQTLMEYLLNSLACAYCPDATRNEQGTESIMNRV